jgi:hypothetical protein
MAHLFVAIFLIVFGLNIIVGLSIPMWVIGLLALIAGVLLIVEHFRIRVVSRPVVVERVDSR